MHILFALILVSAFSTLIAAHKIAAGVIAWITFSAVVDGLPAPTETSRPAYRTLYAVLHVLAANAFRAASALFPKFAAVLATVQPQK